MTCIFFCFQGWVAVAAGYAGEFWQPFSQQHVPAPAGASCRPSSEFWVFARVLKLDVPRKSPEEGAKEAS